MSEEWFRGVIIVKNKGTNDVQMIKRAGKPYNKPGPAKAWVTRHRKEYPSTRGGRKHTVHDTYIERVSGWKRVDNDDPVV